MIRNSTLDGPARSVYTQPPSIQNATDTSCHGTSVSCVFSAGYQRDTRSTTRSGSSPFQPCLIVDDLKLEPAAGGAALWVGPGTEGYFSNPKITAK